MVALVSWFGGVGLISMQCIYPLYEKLSCTCVYTNLMEPGLLMGGEEARLNAFTWIVHLATYTAIKSDCRWSHTLPIPLSCTLSGEDGLITKFHKQHCTFLCTWCMKLIGVSSFVINILHNLGMQPSPREGCHGFSRLYVYTSVPHTHKLWVSSCTFLWICYSVPPPLSVHVGAVYLKNCIFKYWKKEEIEEGEEVPYSIPDVSKVFIRENIVTAIIKAPLLIW